jgi:hypothetical protein
MHWFDRVSTQVAAAPSRTTRRTVLKGATLATLALPFVPDALAQASGSHTRTRALPDVEQLDSNFCANCLARVTYDHREEAKACSRGAKRLARPKGSAGKKLKPAAAARRVGCQAKARKGLVKDLLGCRLHFCKGDEEEPVPNPETGHEACPSGTERCGATICCVGGDSCCPCAGTPEGLICCAGVIGCTCCG